MTGGSTRSLIPKDAVIDVVGWRSSVPPPGLRVSVVRVDRGVPEQVGYLVGTVRAAVRPEVGVGGVLPQHLSDPPHGICISLTLPHDSLRPETYHRSPGSYATLPETGFASPQNPNPGDLGQIDRKDRQPKEVRTCEGIIINRQASIRRSRHERQSDVSKSHVRSMPHGSWLYPEGLNCPTGKPCFC